MASLVVAGYLHVFMIAVLWKSTFPMCLSPPSVKYGEVVKNNGDGTYDIMCEPGYEVYTGGVLTGGDDATEDCADVSTEITCRCIIPTIENADDVLLTAGATDTYDVTCSYGFLASATNPIACSDNAPTCDCDPPYIAYAKIPYVADTTYTYTCKSGYTPSNRGVIPCGMKPPPSCSCIIPQIEHSDDVSLTAGATNTYDVTCTSGFRASATNPIACNDNAPTCHCIIPTIEHSDDVSLTAGATGTYDVTCSFGFLASALNPIACSDSAPKCDCYPPFIAYAMMPEVKGTTYTYTCKSGFTPTHTGPIPCGMKPRPGCKMIEETQRGMTIPEWYKRIFTRGRPTSDAITRDQPVKRRPRKTFRKSEM